ncbi:MAG: quinone oxidoreductase [Chloroflexota bacterium]
MKQVQLNSYGSAKVLDVVEVETPQPGIGELLIKVEAAGVNFSDVLRRRNTYFMPTPLPYILGSEAVGTIIAIGEGVDVQSFQNGQRVLAILPSGGGYAEHVVAAAQYCVPLPAHVNPADATAIFVQGSTAHLILHQVAGDVEGQTVLVHAAAGGVGSLLVQLAKLAGAKVIATSSSDEKLAFARRLGADAAINYTDAKWPTKVIEANGGEKVDLVLEMVGGEVYTQSFACLKPGGTMIVYGAASGQKGMIHSEHFVDENHNLLSFNLAHFVQHKTDLWQASLGAMIGLVAEGQINIQTGHTFALSDVQTAHQQLEDRQTTGKVVLIP